MEIKTKITITEKDLKQILVKQFGLDENTTTVVIHKYDGDQREPSYTNIVVEGKPLK